MNTPENISEYTMENKKSVDKIRRKLLIGAASTPLILTLGGGQVWAAPHDTHPEFDDGLTLDLNFHRNLSTGIGKTEGHYSGMLRGSHGGGSLAREYYLYALFKTNSSTPNGIYYEMVDARDRYVVYMTDILTDTLAGTSTDEDPVIISGRAQDYIDRFDYALGAVGSSQHPDDFPEWHALISKLSDYISSLSSPAPLPDSEDSLSMPGSLRDLIDDLGD